MKNSAPSIRISEIFGPTIQGEGSLIGQPTVFIRTGGCDYRCAWCDTLYAVESQYRDTWKPMQADEIMSKVRSLSGGVPILITLSGGNPAIQPLAPLIRAGKAEGYQFAMETQGSVVQPWFSDLDYLVLSPKPPSSNMHTDYEKIYECMKTAGKGVDITLKIVVMDEVDFKYARDMHERYPNIRMILQPGNHTPLDNPDFYAGGDCSVDINGILDRQRWLVEKVVENKLYGISVLPQLHVLLWGNLRGV